MWTCWRRVTCSDDSAVRAIGDKLGIGWRRVETTVTRSVSVIVDRQLTFPAEGAARDQGPARKDASIVDQVACGRIIWAIQRHVIARHDAHGVTAVQLDVVNGHTNARVEWTDRLGQRGSFRNTYTRLAVHDLSVQVAQFDDVVIDYPQMSNTSRCQINSCRATKSTGS